MITTALLGYVPPMPGTHQGVQSPVRCAFIVGFRVRIWGLGARNSSAHVVASPTEAPAATHLGGSWHRIIRAAFLGLVTL